MDRREVISQLKSSRRELEALGVRRMFLFGSVARDAAGGDSDVDLMVDLDEGPEGRKPLFSAFDVGAIRYALAEILGRKVDLAVRSDALKPGKTLGVAARSELLEVF